MISGLALYKTDEEQQNNYGSIISGLGEKRITRPALDLSVTPRDKEHFSEFPFQIRPKTPF
jgi:hypothetical protein